MLKLINLFRKSEYEKTDNRGMSLVELVVVIAIMAVMIGVGGLSLMLLSSAGAKEAAQKLDSQLNEVKTGAMTRAGEILNLSYIDVDNDVCPFAGKTWQEIGVEKTGYYADKFVKKIDNEPVTPGSLSVVKDGPNDHEYTYLGKDSVGILVEYDDASTISPKTASVAIEFDRKSGAMKNYTYNPETGLKSSKSTITKIYFFRTDDETDVAEARYIIEIVKETGKHTVIDN